jgi:hypothetical protein
MSTFTRELLLVRRGFGDRVDLARRMFARATAGPLLVRGTVFGSALAALFLAYPAEVVGGGRGGLLVVLAALPTLAPRGVLVTTVVLAAVLGWLIATTVYGEPVLGLRLAALAGALYLLHTTAALASVLPYDTVVAPDVLLRWLMRTGVVLALTAGFAVAVLVGVLPMRGAGSYLLASIVGLMVMAGLAWFLAYLRRR